MDPDQTTPVEQSGLCPDCLHASSNLSTCIINCLSDGIKIRQLSCIFGRHLNITAV